VVALGQGGSCLGMHGHKVAPYALKEVPLSPQRGGGFLFFRLPDDVLGFKPENCVPGRICSLDVFW
jgi:hypothetical protein